MEKKPRVASVLIFKDGVKKAEAEKALRKIQDLLEPGLWLDKDRKTTVPFRVEEYDSSWGHPVFYIP